MLIVMLMFMHLYITKTFPGHLSYWAIKWIQRTVRSNIELECDFHSSYCAHVRIKQFHGEYGQGHLVIEYDLKERAFVEPIASWEFLQRP